MIGVRSSQMEIMFLIGQSCQKHRLSSDIRWNPDASHKEGAGSGSNVQIPNFHLQSYVYVKEIVKVM